MNPIQVIASLLSPPYKEVWSSYELVGVYGPSDVTQGLV